ncbi:hypothetical protein EIN_047000 [Entamoeba invadens IP1]|uniref:Uncharacterized protein n=1 Tax=Entamoeba invadens IP1 TaxID=370355 RepID=A0A0A1UG54_ENTIV|nr:hypothetical protein EIN_047000 [Entamoeba invadens IP1]ELP94427.1 hypothetical protein EIN_047000 [Entamoeba invadens IP1]|eukprot:XP_004261198.1 hypothetical protein EIN_047000 [Entamoeba invadens IP1]
MTDEAGDEDEWISVTKEKKPKLKPKPKHQEQHKEKKEEQKVEKVTYVPNPLPHEKGESYSTPERTGSPFIEYDKDTLIKMIKEIGEGTDVYLPPPILKERKRLELMLERIIKREERNSKEQKVEVPPADLPQPENVIPQTQQTVEKSTIEPVEFKNVSESKTKMVIIVTAVVILCISVAFWIELF